MLSTQLFYTAMVALSAALVAYITAVTTWLYGREDRAVGAGKLLFLFFVPMVLATSLNLLSVVGLLDEIAVVDAAGIVVETSMIQGWASMLSQRTDVFLRSRDLLVLNVYSLAAPLTLVLWWVSTKAFLDWVDGERKS